ncbi:hypothetical protein [Candidatus Viridilinea mediisalina]|uniref:hypothetical protein n=1 Tax=Candidatus Viridilinea mediisalina TaxID=2024553 RepID=UPI0013FD2789|nr:hypothetical protein [Candidatus Viridilinea mediisalina]
MVSSFLVFVDASPQHEPNCGSGPGDDQVHGIPGVTQEQDAQAATDTGADQHA